MTVGIPSMRDGSNSADPALEPTDALEPTAAVPPLLLVLLLVLKEAPSKAAVAVGALLEVVMMVSTQARETAVAVIGVPVRVGVSPFHLTADRRLRGAL